MNLATWTISFMNLTLVIAFKGFTATFTATIKEFFRFGHFYDFVFLDLETQKFKTIMISILDFEVYLYSKEEEKCLKR